MLGPLRAAAGPLGALEPEDSATLRFLAAATRERPVILLLDERDAKTGAYAEPVPLGQLLTVSRPEGDAAGEGGLERRIAMSEATTAPAPALEEPPAPAAVLGVDERSAPRTLAPSGAFETAHDDPFEGAPTDNP